MVIPSAVDEVLEQLRPILTRIYEERGSVGEIAITYGGHQFQVEERPRIKHEGIPYARDWGRAKVLKAAKT